ncbi:ATP-dependent RNA helicase DBP7 [Yarrowia sp. C11]|nr:ATP-dependent RNA helicase DBP7 [Yarrowia sp. E02]KAG5367706.1 ATP-dependent RNA helicase DBP7 [Yarrowia sp. C11]
MEDDGMMLNLVVADGPRQLSAREKAAKLKKSGLTFAQRKALREEEKKNAWKKEQGGTATTIEDRMKRREQDKPPVRQKPYDKPAERKPAEKKSYEKAYDKIASRPVAFSKPVEETDEEKYQRLMEGGKRPEKERWVPQRNFRNRRDMEKAAKSSQEGGAQKHHDRDVIGTREDGTLIRRMREKTGAKGGIKGTYVSSIFSEKKEDRLAGEDVQMEEEEEEEDTNAESSNAALKDSTTFAGLGCSQRLVDALVSMELAKPTKIQRGTIPRLIQRERDLFVQAQTGSGKTLAFVLPVLERIMSCDDVNRESGLFAVILTPTRELTTQIYSVLETLCRKACPWIVPGIVIGGEKKKSEKARIRKGVNILVATPGRLADHFDNTEALDLSQVRWVVLDEGDRLMELGFEETITKILRTIEWKSVLRGENYLKEIPKNLKALPSRRVTVLCSATMKGGVTELGKSTLKDADWVSNDSVEDALAETSVETFSAPSQLVQEWVVVPAKLRLVTLLGALRGDILQSSEKTNTKVIVFLSCSDSVDFHFDVLSRDGSQINKMDTAKTAPLLLEDKSTSVYKLHGSLSQQARTATLASFAKNSTPSILLCTDVASRGLDLPKITHVIEYDPPFSIEDHLHRVGRTARAGHDGRALLFLLPGAEEGYVEKLKQSQQMKKTTYENILAAGFGGKGWDFAATNYHLDVERWVLGDETALDRARRGFTSHIRAYATHIAAEKDMFNVRMLHLGHLAKSFALREAPGKLGKKKDPEKIKVNKDGSLDETQARKKMLDRSRKHVYNSGESAMGGYVLE